MRSKLSPPSSRFLTGCVVVLDAAPGCRPGNFGVLAGDPRRLRCSRTDEAGMLFGDDTSQRVSTHRARPELRRRIAAERVQQASGTRTT